MPLSLVCGAECQMASAPGAAVDVHWTTRQAGSAGTPTTTATVARSGDRSYHFAAATSGSAISFLSYQRLSTSVSYARFYFRFPDVTPSDLVVFAQSVSSGAVYGALAILGTDGEVFVSARDSSGSVYSVSNNFSPSADTWYGIEWEVDCSVANAVVVKWRWWSEATGWSTSETVTNTGTFSAQTIIRWDMGVIYDAVAGFVVYIDDVAVGSCTSTGELYDDTGTNGVDGYVLRYSPNADGTHSFDTTGDFKEWTGGALGADFAVTDTDVWTFLDEPNMEQQAEAVRDDTTDSTEYVEVHLADEATYSAPRGVSVVTAVDSNGTTAQQVVDVSDNGTDWVNGASGSYSPDSFFQTMLSTAPSGAAWSRDLVNATRVRLHAAADHQLYHHGIALEVEWTLYEPTQQAVPTDDIQTTGWSSTPLWSKVDDDPASPDGVVISASAV